MRNRLTLVMCIVALSGCAGSGTSSDTDKACSGMMGQLMSPAANSAQTTQTVNAYIASCPDGQWINPSVIAQVARTYVASNDYDAGLAAYQQLQNHYRPFLKNEDQLAFLEGFFTLYRGKALKQAGAGDTKAAIATMESYDTVIDQTSALFQYRTRSTFYAKSYATRVEVGDVSDGLFAKYVTLLNNSPFATPDDYQHAIQIATARKNKKALAWLNKQAPVMAEVDRLALMNYPKPAQYEPVVQYTAQLNRATFKADEFEKRGLQELANTYRLEAITSEKILAQKQQDAQKYAQMEQENREYEQKRDAENNQFISALLGAMGTSATSIAAGENTRTVISQNISDVAIATSDNPEQLSAARSALESYSASQTAQYCRNSTPGDFKKCCASSNGKLMPVNKDADGTERYGCQFDDRAKTRTGCSYRNDRLVPASCAITP